MQILCDGLDLSDAVLKVSKAMATKTTNPILEGIKLEAEGNELTLTATNLELSIQKKIRATVKQEGTTVVPGKFFADFIRKLTNEKISLSLCENNNLTISYIDSEGTIACYNPNEFPAFKNLNENNYFSINKKSFKNVVQKTLFSVAVDDTRPILKGCLLEIETENLKCISSDGYRISLANAKVEFSNITKNCIVPEKSLKEISKLIDDNEDLVNISVESNFLMVDLGDTKIITRLLEGEFFNYKQIVQSIKEETSIIVQTSLLQDSLERASLLSKVGQNNLVKYSITEDSMTITSNSEIGNIKEKIAVKQEGKDLEIAFNARYYLEALNSADKEFVKISFNSASYPCYITSTEDSEEFLFLILPVRMIG